MGSMMGGRSAGRVCALLLATAVCPGSVWGADAAIEKATERAVEEAVRSLDEADLGTLSLAIHPLRGDDGGAATELLQIGVTNNTPHKHYIRDESAWEKIIQEVDWETDVKDMMEPGTIQRFQIAGVEALVYGSISEPRLSFLTVSVRMNLHLANVSTGEHVWGDAVEGSAYRPVSDFKWYILGIVAVLILLIGYRRATRVR